MQQLDEWTDTTAIMPLADPRNEDNFDAVVEQVKKAIREKVLESYKNGIKAGTTKAHQPGGKAPQ